MQRRNKGGRPRREVNAMEVQRLSNSGMSLRHIADVLKIGKTTVARKLSDVTNPPDASQYRGNLSQNSPSLQSDETTLPGATEAPEPSANPIREQPTDDPEDDEVPAPRVQTVGILRRVHPKVTSDDRFPRPIDGHSPGPCPDCGSRIWRLTEFGTLVCPICYPVH